MKRLIILICLVLMHFAVSAQGQNDGRIKQLRKFNTFYSILTSSYVDSIEYEKLVDRAIVDVLESLDPHSTYYTAKEMASENERMDGSFSGIGVEFNVIADTIIVVNTINDAPAAKAGLLANDRIIEVDGVNVVGTKRGDVPKLLRGPKGSRVELTIVRRNVAPQKYTLTRDDIPINTIDASYMVNDSVGYVRINRFARTTFAEFLLAFHQLGKPTALILDLRGNGGGLLSEAISLSSFFLPEGRVIVSTEGEKMPPQTFKTNSDGMFLDGTVVVLIDESSASASEIVSGALQDWDRALIVGRPSFGKGLVQRQFMLDDGSAVRVTVSRYKTPSGRAIQRPFTPGDKEGYYRNHYKRYGHHDSIPEDAPRHSTLLLERTVYGGGGIYPDVYIERDTTNTSKYWAELVRTSTLQDFVVKYIDENRKQLERQYPTFEEYMEEFDSQDMASDLIKFADKRGIKPDEQLSDKSNIAIQGQLKALLAQKLWSTNEYYRVYNALLDDDFAKALEIIAE